MEGKREEGGKIPLGATQMRGQHLKDIKTPTHCAPIFQSRSTGMELAPVWFAG